jgi:sigma-B regulation protein RsbU (phosphoserine phosphatase)
VPIGSGQRPSGASSPPPPQGPTTSEQLLSALQLLVRSSHVVAPDDLSELVTSASRELGADTAALYLVDYDQVELVPLIRKPHGRGEGHDEASGPGADADVDRHHVEGPLVINATLAGRAYTDLKQLTSTTGSGLTLWTPVLDGTDRLGVLRQDFPREQSALRRNQSELSELSELSETLLEGCRDVASLLAHLAVSRSECGDVVERTRRRAPMTLPAELAWRALPPLTFVSPRVAVAGVLAPSTDVGGDNFDFALNGDTLHVALFDAMGHGLQAALLATVAVGALRNARRSGAALTETVSAIDSAIESHFEPGVFVTGIVGELDVVGGWWRWATCGHAPALLVRHNRVVKQLDAVTDVPLGLGALDRAQVGVERLQPGDRLLLHTDGVSEARNEAGEFFGTDRLVEFVSRQAADGRPVAETMRRLSHAILHHQHGALQDDATTVVIEWLGDQQQLGGVPA